jgi:hypothetical protein
MSGAWPEFTGGPAKTLGTIVPGTLYTAGTYNNVAMTGGAGSGCRCNIVVAAGGVSSATIVAAGSDYVVGDALSAAAANIGGTGSGFSVPITATGATGANQWPANLPASLDCQARPN